jgi:hypothetical protein
MRLVRRSRATFRFAECHPAWRGLQNAKNVRQLYPGWPGSYHAAVVKSWLDTVCISADAPRLKEK